MGNVVWVPGSTAIFLNSPFDSYITANGYYRIDKPNKINGFLFSKEKTEVYTSVIII